MPVFHGRLSVFLQEHFLYNETGKYGFNNFPMHFSFFPPILVKVRFNLQGLHKNSDITGIPQIFKFERQAVYNILKNKNNLLVISSVYLTNSKCTSLYLNDIYIY